jgi:hypothetical protein
MQTSIQGRDETQTGLAAEIKIVPTWAWVIAGMFVIATQIVFDVVIPMKKGGPPVWARPLLGLLAGMMAGAYFLFIGYINRDAKRRGMSPWLWTVVAVVIPNALGILLYFILRQPRPSMCPQCGGAVRAEFNFCPVCNCRLSPSCPQCKRVIGASDVYCPYCGTGLRGQVAPGATVMG